jgi:hypothetical protein
LNLERSQQDRANENKHGTHRQHIQGMVIGLDGSMHSKLPSGPARLAKLSGAFLFELRRSVPLDLFHQGGPNALDQPDAIRGHGQEQLGRTNPGSDKYARYPNTELTVVKPKVSTRLGGSPLHVVLHDKWSDATTQPVCDQHDFPPCGRPRAI